VSPPKSDSAEKIGLREKNLTFLILAVRKRDEASEEKNIPNTQSTTSMKKITTSAAQVITVAALTFGSAASATTISVDFMGNSSLPPMVTTDTAGVTPAQFWEPAFGLIGSVSPLTGGGTASGAIVQWNSQMSWAVLGYLGGSVPGPGDDKMMSRGIATFLASTSPPTASPITVDVMLPSLATLGWTSYDVYVYSSHANGGAGGLSEITHSDSGGVTPINLTESGPSFGTVVGSTYLDGGINPTGNYVRYTGKTDLNFRISSTPAVPFPNNDISIINGIQIIGVPEPSTALLGILGGALALLRRKRA
jgi:hypothetical protein